MTDALKIGAVKALPGERASGWLVAGELDQLRFARGQIRLPLIVSNGKRSGPMLALIAGQHPGEYVGMNAAISIALSVDLDALVGSVVAIPALNPHGVKQKVPYVCPFDGLNMNRQWPGSYGGTVSARTTHAVWQEVISRADYLVDLHGGDFPEYQADYAICFETGNAENDSTSREMARHFGARYIRTSPPSEGGNSSGPAARMSMQLLGIPAIVTEVGDAGVLDADKLRANINGLLNVMKLLEMLPGKPELPPSDQREMVSRIPVLSRVGGLSQLMVTIGQHVFEGAVLAQIRNWSGEIVEEVRSPIEGDVVQLFYQGWMNEGEIVAKIAALAPIGE